MQLEPERQYPQVLAQVPLYRPRRLYPSWRQIWVARYCPPWPTSLWEITARFESARQTTQRLPDSVSTPPEHTVGVEPTQAPLVQVWPDAHALLHRPQWVVLVLMLASQPSLLEPLQLAKPALHAMPQVPPTQVADALEAAGQVLPQRPQWVVLAEVAVSQPSIAAPLQSPKLAWQT